MADPMMFPGDRRFAFTILDDTDDATLENVKPVYDLLMRLGMRTTKTVWPLDSPQETKGHYHRGETLEDEGYRDWILELAAAGFEIAFHNASMTSSRRERTVQALGVMRDLFGTGPSLHCNHGQNEENLYWGADRYVGARRLLLRPFIGRLTDGPRRYSGHVAASPFFWGDVALEQFRYVRAFTFNRVNCAEIPGAWPYSDPTKPWVRCWFNTADASTVRDFKRLLTRSRIASLRARGGWCILSTHLGKGFAPDGRLDPEVEDILGSIADEQGWFVPTSELLDHLCEISPPRPLGSAARLAVEVQHIADRVSGRLLYR